MTLFDPDNGCQVETLPADTPRESWLRGGSHTRHAVAATMCRHQGAFCAGDGYCHRNGGCFEDEPCLLADHVERLAAEQGVDLADLVKALMGRVRR